MKFQPETENPDDLDQHYDLEEGKELGSNRAYPVKSYTRKLVMG